MKDWLTTYENMLRHLIDANKNYLDSKGVRLKKAIENYLETWAEIESIVSKKDKNMNIVMNFAVSYLWFPAEVFSLVFNVLTSNILGALKSLRYALEALEIGLIGDSHPNLRFNEMSIEEKVNRLREMRPKEILDSLKPLVSQNTLSELIQLYKQLSETAHPASFSGKIIQLYHEKGEVPSIALYYPDLSELESEFENLAELIEDFCKVARKITEIWMDCIHRRDIA